MRTFSQIFAAFSVGILGLAHSTICAAALAENAYVWQRHWSAMVSREILRQGPSFDQLDVLAGELDLADRSTVRPHLDWAALRRVGRPVALVLRVDHFAPKSADQTADQRIVAVCQTLLQNAREAGVEPAELQIDCDCATSGLGAYTALIQAVRREVTPAKLTLTALPAWLGSSDLPALVRQVDAFVLQVHSVERPDRPGDATVRICDPVKALRWIEQAKRLGRPFRVALPDYGYRLGFDSQARLAGVQAEGSAREWPSGTRVETVMADPAAVAAIVRSVHEHPADLLTGIAWFRLPMPEDDLVWSAPTLAAVRRGVSPHPNVRLELAPAADGAEDLWVVNLGDGTSPLNEVALPLTRGKPLAWDLTSDWRGRVDQAGTLFVLPTDASTPPPLRPGERRLIGWVRYGPTS